jgi:hypothetical protein
MQIIQTELSKKDKKTVIDLTGSADSSFEDNQYSVEHVPNQEAAEHEPNQEAAEHVPNH